MSDIKNVLIGIQARSGSTRLPSKTLLPFGGGTILDAVLAACEKSAAYLNHGNYKGLILNVRVGVLIPFGDEVKRHVKSKAALVMEGPEADVLARYEMAVKQYGFDYICRITADCPLIQPHIITPHIRTAVMTETDYFSNVDEDIRTAIDGFDCEVISKRLIEWCDQQARLPADREHVTTLIRREPPEWAIMGCSIGYIDQSDLKYSVDTKEDYNRVLAANAMLERKLRLATERYGGKHVHRF